MQRKSSSAKSSQHSAAPNFRESGMSATSVLLPFKARRKGRDRRSAGPGCHGRKSHAEQMMSALPRIATDARIFQIGSLVPQGDIQSSIRLFRRRGASAHQPRRAAALRKRLSTNAEASPTSATGASMAGAAGQPKDSTQRASTAGPAN